MTGLHAERLHAERRSRGEAVGELRQHGPGPPVDAEGGEVVRAGRAEVEDGDGSLALGGVSDEAVAGVDRQ